MFDLTKSLKVAEARLKPGGHKPRSDRGSSRFDPRACAVLDELFSSQERPRMASVLEELRARCVTLGVTPPSRATVYNYRDRAPVPTLDMRGLPREVRETLYNLSSDAMVPAHQVAFRAINEGGARAVSYAAGLPWLALHRARGLRGWRPRSRGLIVAICRARGI